MSRRTKLLITGLFLLLLSVPAAYVALTMHVADPFVFRYVGHGEVIMQPENADVSGTMVPTVKIQLEMCNATSLPIYLYSGEVTEARDRGGMPLASLEWREGPVPRDGIVPLETVVTPEVAQRLEKGETFEVAYKSLSQTQARAYELSMWATQRLYKYLHISIDSLETKPDESVTRIIVDPAHRSQPPPSKTTASP